jgi:acyl dehydratase
MTRSFFYLYVETAKQSLFGGLCASGWHAASMFMHMLIDNLPEEYDSPGINHLKWLNRYIPAIF